MVKPTVLAAVKDAEPVTHPRDAVVPDDAWYAHPAVDTVRRALGVDHCLYSVHPLRGKDRRAGWVCLHRPWGDRRRFGRREREVLHSLHVELAWVYDRAATPPPRASAATDHPATATLTDRQRQTLDRLLAGRSEKQVAAELGLSRHTVHVHVKSLYRTFHVNSRHELLAKFIHRSE
jgi:DNA-binding CsgD family transcriptional regulator